MNDWGSWFQGTGGLLEPMNRYVGVGMALLGACVAAPAGCKHLLRISRGWAAAGRRWFTEVLPFLRREVPVVSGAGQVGVVVELTGRAFGHNRSWTPEADADIRIAELHDYVVSVEKYVDYKVEEYEGRFLDISNSLSRIEQRIEKTSHTMSTTFEVNEKRAAQVDAIGLPVIRTQRHTG
ncbi:hypothetical protein [Specibacter sp. RAF43]|uniref:hypothetical protein n=1 Tax=Specibacter sp. RAF43 TaxID=3233057 RepID=UPI003F9A49B3